MERPAASTAVQGRHQGVLTKGLLSALVTLGILLGVLGPLPKPASAVVNAFEDTSMPWSMHLEFTDDNRFCTGFMLTEHWIVTAAHCIDDRTTQDDPVVVSYMENGRREVVYSGGTANYYPHPDYLANSGVHNDVGLIRIHGALIAPELRAPLYADVMTRYPDYYAWRGHTDTAYIAGYGFGSEPGGISDCEDPDLPSGTRRLGVLGLTGGVYPATAGLPLGLKARPQIGNPCNGDSGSAWTFRKAFKHFVFAVHSGGTASIKTAALLHPRMAWILHTTQQVGPRISCPVSYDTDADLEFRQCTEGHRMLVREGTGSPSVWRTGSTDLGFVSVGDVDGNGADDLIRYAANRFFVSWAGRSVWVPTPATHVTGATYAFGDFDGNGTTDILRSLNGSWHARLSRPDRTWSEWQVTRITNDRLMPETIVGDYDGDGVDDLFRAKNGEFQVSWGSFGGSHGSWQRVKSSSLQTSSVRVGDFDGDGADEVFYANGSTWRVSFSPHSRGLWTAWDTIGTSSATILEIADFDENGTDDVFRSSGGAWKVSYSTRNRSVWSHWTVLRYSSVPVSSAAFGNFDEVGGTDALYLASCPQYC